MSRRKAKPVLLDNYTLQGAYCFLQEGKRAPLYEECLSHLIESVIIYDQIIVPEDVLSRNRACQQVAQQFSGFIVGKSMPWTPDIHHHVVDRHVVEEFRPLLERSDPFGRFETPEAYDIERAGRDPFFSPPGWMGRYERPLTFSERHTYYSWYCVRLAAALGLNYAPNPTRVNLFENDEFLRLEPFPDFQRDILDYFETVRERHADSMNRVFRSLRQPLDLPMVYSHIKSKAQESAGIIAETIRLRNSREAAAFRTLCAELEEASQSGDAAKVDEIRGQIEELGGRWSESLAKPKTRKKWGVRLGIFGTDFETPWFKLQAVDQEPHFVFLHSLLSTS
jgi:hypothetical protein